MIDEKELKGNVKAKVGRFSNNEFNDAFHYVKFKYCNNPSIEKRWYLATVIGETILQKRLTQFCFNDSEIKRVAPAWEA